MVGGRQDGGGGQRRLGKVLILLGRKLGQLTPSSTRVAFKKGTGRLVAGEIGQRACAWPMQPKGYTEEVGIGRWTRKGCRKKRSLTLEGLLPSRA